MAALIGPQLPNMGPELPLTVCHVYGNSCDVRFGTWPGAYDVHELRVAVLRTALPTLPQDARMHWECKY